MIASISLNTTIIASILSLLILATTHHFGMQARIAQFHDEAMQGRQRVQGLQLLRVRGFPSWDCSLTGKAYINRAKERKFFFGYCCTAHIRRQHWSLGI